MEQKRIWELDFLRGIFILGMIIIHTVYDLQTFLELPISTSPIYNFIQYNGGILFILISGICVTLGKHFVKRGLIVFAAGILVSSVTFGMVYFEMADQSMIIYWGILHLLGACMLLSGLLRKMPLWALIGLGTLFILMGYQLDAYVAHTMYFCFLGLTPPGFVTADYFPLLPYLGWFMLGIVLGRLFYKNKVSLLPKFPHKALPIRWISFCGRHSLWIYLIHQPVLYGIMMLLAQLQL